MDHIAAEAGVAKPILYRHFGDKGELYRALVDRYVQELIGELRGAWSETSPRAQLSGAIDTYLAFIDREREAYRFLMHRAVGEPEARVAVSQFIAQVATEVAVLLGDDLRRFGVDSGAAEPWAHGIVGLVQLSGEWWLDHPTMSRAALVDYLVTLLWSGFSGLEAGASNVRG
jgi:AcrR family transcriptional regulator